MRIYRVKNFCECFMSMLFRLVYPGSSKDFYNVLFALQCKKFFRSSLTYFQMEKQIVLCLQHQFIFSTLNLLWTFHLNFAALKGLFSRALDRHKRLNSVSFISFVLQHAVLQLLRVITHRRLFLPVEDGCQAFLKIICLFSSKVRSYVCFP